MLNPAPKAPPVPASVLARLFIRLSLTAFGGPIAHIAIMEDELVARRNWMTREEFLDLVAAANLIPGPTSTEVAIHVGYTMYGIPGAFLTGLCFIIPAFLITLTLAALYVATGSIPQAASLLWGIQPVIVAVIANAAYRLTPTSLKNRLLWIVFAAAFLAAGPLNVPEVIVIVGAGITYMLLAGFAMPTTMSAITALPGLHLAMQNAPAQVAVSLNDLFFYFLRIGSVLFGSGYVLFAYIQQDLVNTFGWLNTRQLLDAVAIGQFTPGPVLTTVAVIGYLISGVPGAIAAALGVFLPSFVLVILTAPLLPRMRASKPFSAFLSGVNAGVIAAILVTLWDLAQAALRTLDGTAFSPLAVVMMVTALTLLLRWKVNATWLILAGAGIGLIAA